MPSNELFQPRLVRGDRVDGGPNVLIVDDIDANLVALEAVLSSLRTAYRNLNTPPTTATTTGTNAGGPASAYQMNQIANYQLALNMLGGGTQA